MWSYYELTTAQTQADRFNEAGCMLPAAAKREFPQDAVRRALVHQSRAEEAEKQEGRRTSLAAIVNAFRTALRGPAVAR